MKMTALKLGISIAMLPLSTLLLEFTDHDIFGWLFLAAIPVIVLYWFDLGHKMRHATDSHPAVHALGVIMGIPQALFGLASLGTGLAIIAWVLYNSIIERLPEYSGGLMALGIAPILISFGAFCLVSAFRCSDNQDDNA